MGGTNHFYVASTLQLIQKMASSISKLFQLHHWLLSKKSKPFARNNNNIGNEKLWEVHKKNLFQGPLSGALWHFNKTFAKFAHSLALKLIQLFSKRKCNYQVRNDNQHWGWSSALQKWAIFNLMSRLRDTLAMFSTDSTASFDVNTRRGFCTEGVIFKCSCGIKRHFHSQPVCATVPNRLPQGGLNFIDKGFFCQHHHCSPSPPCSTTTLCSSTWRGKAL